DEIGWGSVIPSRTNSGATRSSTESRASATRRRSAGVVRSRRGRREGRGEPEGDEAVDVTWMDPTYRTARPTRAVPVLGERREAEVGADAGDGLEEGLGARRPASQRRLERHAVGDHLLAAHELDGQVRGRPGRLPVDRPF